MNYIVTYKKGHNPQKDCLYIGAEYSDIEKTAAERQWTLLNIVECSTIKETLRGTRKAFLESINKIAEGTHFCIKKYGIGITYSQGIDWVVVPIDIIQKQSGYFCLKKKIYEGENLIDFIIETRKGEIKASKYFKNIFEE